MAPHIAVVDLETTGFGKTDKIVEVAIVLLDGSTLDVIDEYDTLINPMRDIGATHVHGITASMVEAAPTFDDVADYLAQHLNGHIVAAHNLSFDSRFLRQEYNRTSTVLDLGVGIDTLALSGERLPEACARHGITYSSEHWALADARAAAALLREVADGVSGVPCVSPATTTRVPRSVPRTTPGRGSTAHLRTRLPATGASELAYLDTLDIYLADTVLDDHELANLLDLAEVLGIGELEREALHFDYLSAAIAGAQRDHVITPAERDMLTQLATTLGVDQVTLPEITEQVTATTLDGLRVCFTGSATIGGRPMERRDLEALAAVRGLQPVSSVTKKGCDLVVAADASSTSGKAKKAREWGIPVISVEEFLDRSQSTRA